MKLIIIIFLILTKSFVIAKQESMRLEDNYKLHKNPQLSDEVLLKISIANLSSQLRESKKSFYLRNGNYKITKKKEVYTIYIFDNVKNELQDKFTFYKKRISNGNTILILNEADNKERCD